MAYFHELFLFEKNKLKSLCCTIFLNDTVLESRTSSHLEYTSICYKIALNLNLR